MIYQDVLKILPNLKGKSIVKDNGCWIYTGYTQPFGHARIKYGEKRFLLHRLIFCLNNNLNYDDKSFQANHKPECNNGSCFNPDHIYAGDQSDNRQDAINLHGHHNSNKTHCPSGHEYDMVDAYNHRRCKRCVSELAKTAKKKYRAKQKLIKMKKEMENI